MLAGTAPEPPAAPPDLTGLALSVARARKDYQACRYAELVNLLPRLLSQLDTARRCLTGDERRRACALSAGAYHVAAGFLLKTGDQGLAHIATDRSMTAALASQDPLTVGASGRIVTHTLMSSGHLTAAVTLGDAGTAIDLARQIDLGAVTITERKASLLIDVARAFFQWGKYEQAHAALRAAEATAPQEVAARPPVATLARDLATLAPVGIRRDAEQFATRIGAPR